MSEKTQLLSARERIDRALGELIATILVFGSFAGVIYAFWNRAEIGWYWAPLSLVIGSFTIMVGSAFTAPPRSGGDMTSQYEGMGAALLMFMAWILAGALAIGHYL